jgi:hypothetical protein
MARARRKITPGSQKIELYCLCWNDARMLPYFFRHYDQIVDKYFIFDNGSTDRSLSILEKHEKVDLSHFDVEGDSFCEEECRLCDSIWLGSDADWVIIPDIDEHIYHPDLRGYLRECADTGITAIESIGYEMISEAFPSESDRLVETVTVGTRSIGHDRLCIFNPRQIAETNFSMGRHRASPTGHVEWPEYPEVLLLHYKQLGLEYPIARSAQLRQGLRPLDLEKQWGVHYTWSAEEITEKWNEIHAVSGPVPGLGELSHIPPAVSFRDDHIVKRSGLFDGEWYLNAYPDVKEASANAFTHYCSYGWKEDRRPNFYFDPEWYCENYPELCTPGRNALCDYVESGERKGASPSPLFDTSWYRNEHSLDVEVSPLRHYLVRRLTGAVSPIPDFDVADYCHRHPEVLATGKDPFEDYCSRPGQD